jgi:hypothetical protein
MNRDPQQPVSAETLPEDGEAPALTNKDYFWDWEDD